MSTKRIERIRSLEHQAEREEAKAGELHWTAASLVVEELEAGTSQRDLAAEVGKSQAWISQAARAWRRWGADNPGDRPTWNAALQGFESGADRAAAARTSIPRDPEERIEVARKLLEDPKVRRAVRDVPDEEDRSGGDRRDPVPSIEAALGRIVRRSWGEATAERLLDIAEDIEARELSASDRKLIQPAADRIVTALLEESIR